MYVPLKFKCKSFFQVLVNGTFRKLVNFFILYGRKENKENIEERLKGMFCSYSQCDEINIHLCVLLVWKTLVLKKMRLAFRKLKCHF